MLVGYRQGRVALERHPARDHLEEDRAQRVDVRPLVGVLALDLLGRHVLGRPDDHSLGGHAGGAQGAGDPEVHDLGVPLFIHHDVLGLEVPVDDAQVVGLGQPFADLLGDGDRSAGRQRPGLLDQPLEVLPRHILHRDEQLLAVLVELVHPADVLVGDPAGQLDLVPEAVNRLLVEGDIGVENLEGDLLADFLIVGAVDDAHPAGAQLLDELEPPGEQLPLPSPSGVVSSVLVTEFRGHVPNSGEFGTCPRIPGRVP